MSAVASDHQFQAVAMVFSEDFDHDDGGGRHTIILNTLFEIFSFCPKISTLISRENCRFFGGKKLVKMLWFLTFKLLTTFISREKCRENVRVFVKIEFLDKNLTFRIVCSYLRE